MVDEERHEVNVECANEEDGCDSHAMDTDEEDDSYDETSDGVG